MGCSCRRTRRFTQLRNPNCYAPISPKRGGFGGLKIPRARGIFKFSDRAGGFAYSPGLDAPSDLAESEAGRVESRTGSLAEVSDVIDRSPS